MHVYLTLVEVEISQDTHVWARLSLIAHTALAVARNELETVRIFDYGFGESSEIFALVAKTIFYVFLCAPRHGSFRKLNACLERHDTNVLYTYILVTMMSIHSTYRISSSWFIARILQSLSRSQEGFKFAAPNRSFHLHLPKNSWWVRDFSINLPLSPRNFPSLFLCVWQPLRFRLPSARAYINEFKGSAVVERKTHVWQ